MCRNVYDPHPVELRAPVRAVIRHRRSITLWIMLSRHVTFSWLVSRLHDPIISERNPLASCTTKRKSVGPEPAERRAGDQGVDDAVERVRHRESRALAPPDPVLPERNDVAAEGDDTAHAEHLEEWRARSV